MATQAKARVARADVVGSLLRPAYLREARQGVRDGVVNEAQLRAAEDRAVQEVIALQESIGLDVITDGEMRREGWNAPLRAALSGFTAFPGGTGYRWRTGAPAQNQVRDDTGRTWPFVTDVVQVQRDVAQTEYAFLNAHAQRRTKYCLPAPSYYRTHWHEERSSAAYPTAELFLEDAATVEARIHEAAAYVPLERLALSPQCGFASVEAGNPITPEDQAAKLRVVVEVARRIWP